MTERKKERIRERACGEKKKGEKQKKELVR